MKLIWHKRDCIKAAFLVLVGAILAGFLPVHGTKGLVAGGIIGCFITIICLAKWELFHWEKE